VRISDFSFHLPGELIARFPHPERDQSRMMVVERKTGHISHHRFRDIVRMISPDDFVVLNHSRVVPARLLGEINGYPVEILIVNRRTDREAEVLALPARKFKDGNRVTFGDGLEARVSGLGFRGRRILTFNRPFERILEAGFAPLPPYIKRKSVEARQYREFDLNRYQTVYSSRPGSIAAPTAGLHFTPLLLKQLSAITDVLEINLQVGEATFQKIEADDIEDHRMGSETVSISREVRAGIKSRKKTRTLIAVGTTTVRALETYARDKPEAVTFESELFIYPGFEFQMVDKMITNFHLPESSLFIMVSAFAGLELMQKAYRIAVEEQYRFFSYGDAMFII
jgi:S-adenosylmethionine:tRNA ribosyltransferase-isomerase